MICAAHSDIFLKAPMYVVVSGVNVINELAEMTYVRYENRPVLHTSSTGL